MQCCKNTIPNPKYICVSRDLHFSRGCSLFPGIVIVGPDLIWSSTGTTKNQLSCNSSCWPDQHISTDNGIPVDHEPSHLPTGFLFLLLCGDELLFLCQRGATRCFALGCSAGSGKVFFSKGRKSRGGGGVIRDGFLLIRGERQKNPLTSELKKTHKKTAVESDSGWSAEVRRQAK